MTMCLLIGAYPNLASLPQRLGERALSSLVITFQRDGSQALEKDIPGL